MIKIIDVDNFNVCTIYADTKDEVPETGAETVVSGYNGTIGSASILYTAKFEVAVLKSDDTWEWGD